MLPPILMQLYIASAAGGGRAVWMLMREWGLQFELKKVFGSDSSPVMEIPEDEQSQPRLHSNPNVTSPQVSGLEWHRLGDDTLPMLKDRGLLIWECTAILRYLCNTQDVASHWYPEDKRKRAVVDGYLDWHHHLHRVTRTVLDVTTGSDPSLPPSAQLKVLDIEKIAQAMRDYIGTMAIVETQFLQGERNYIAGDTISVADVVCCSEISYYKAIDVDMTPFPRIALWFDRVKAKIACWDEVNADFNQYVNYCSENRRKQQVKQAKIMKHGKDAAGGNRAPDIYHTVYFQKEPAEIWALLIDGQELSRRTNSHCSFSSKSGGPFSYYNKTIEGSNLYIEKEKRLLQSWRHNDWPKGTMSTVRISLEKSGESGSGTQLLLTQSDVPPNFIKKTDHLWDEKFWIPLGGVLVRDILQQVFFENLSPHDVYMYLTDSQKATKMTGKRCEVSRGVGGDVSYLDGLIVGKHTQLVTDVKVVQQWRCSDWPSGHHSTLALEIKRVAGGTSVIHSQANVPVKNYRSVCDVWDRYFWKRMMKETTTGT